VRSLDDWSITSTREFNVSITLPLRFLNFKAEEKQAAVLLNWKTTDEVNTSYFEVERSNDGLHFEKTGSVTATNRAGINDYVFYDKTAIKGINYYRIRQVDKDGRFIYSAIVYVNIAVAKLRVYPNPVTKFVTIDKISKGGTIIVLDNEGRQLMQLKNNNAHSIKIDVLQLPAGIYTLCVYDGKVIMTEKFIKQ
jgi:Secretion system C-terminal sorting domain